MSRETLGYVKLEWTCPKCGSRNPGPEKVCQNCGAPQPENVEFVQAAGQEAQQDVVLKKIAEKGPDIHCPFCGTRNPSDAVICSQCGGDLKEGVKREAGRVVGSYAAVPVKEIPCPNCNALNPETETMCKNCGAPLGRESVSPKPSEPVSTVPKSRSNLFIYGTVAALILLCICVIAGIIYASSPRETQQANVQSVNWQTFVAIEELRPVTRQTWEDQIPAGAEIGNCVDRIYTTVASEPSVGKFNKVCGTPYTIDTGSGVGEVVQDCEYQVLAPFCEYTVSEWQVVDRAGLQGSDLNPLFASPSLVSGQRLGAQEVDAVVIFETEKGRYNYRPRSIAEFQQYQINSVWNLRINAFGDIVSVEPP